MDAAAATLPEQLADMAPADALRAMLAPHNAELALATLRALTQDPVYTPVIVDAIRSGKLDLRLAMGWLSEMIKPRRYLEVGVRRGFSMTAVASRTPDVDIYGFDMWVKRYAGVGNPGPRFVRGELARIGHRGSVELIGGNSHETLPRFFGDAPYSAWARFTGRAVAAPSEDFDMILIDGDHSIEGAYADLKQVIGHVRVGGAIVFDDIAPDLSGMGESDLAAVRAELGPDPQGRGGLLGVWEAIEREHPNFTFFTFTEDSPGVAFAVRVS